MSEKERFVVSTNTVGEIIVTDTETGNVYHYGNMGNFLGLIRLLNEQQARIEMLEKGILDCLFNNKSIGILAEEMRLVE